MTTTSVNAFVTLFNRAKDISGTADDFRREEILNLLGRPLRAGRAGARLAVEVPGGLVLVNRRTTTPGVVLFCFVPAGTPAGMVVGPPSQRFWMNESSVEGLLTQFETAPEGVFEELLA